MLANPALYNVEDLKYAVTRFMERGHEWNAPLAKHAQRHPDSRFLKLLQGLVAEGRADSGAAIQCYAANLGASQAECPIALWRLGKLFSSAGQNAEAYSLLHQARIVRPDFNFLVGTVLSELSAQLPQRDLRLDKLTTNNTK